MLKYMSQIAAFVKLLPILKYSQNTEKNHRKARTLWHTYGPPQPSPLNKTKHSPGSCCPSAAINEEVLCFLFSFQVSQVSPKIQLKCDCAWAHCPYIGINVINYTHSVGVGIWTIIAWVLDFFGMVFTNFPACAIFPVHSHTEYLYWPAVAPSRRWEQG